ncbi:MAG TPA: hypothetical protein VK048_03145 [Atopostipes sp.]|nr:hypothetical protein [Atopostipes sp.]
MKLGHKYTTENGNEIMLTEINRVRDHTTLKGDIIPHPPVIVTEGFTLTVRGVLMKNDNVISEFEFEGGLDLESIIMDFFNIKIENYGK